MAPAWIADVSFESAVSFCFLERKVVRRLVLCRGGHATEQFEIQANHTGWFFGNLKTIHICRFLIIARGTFLLESALGRVSCASCWQTDCHRPFDFPELSVHALANSEFLQRI